MNRTEHKVRGCSFLGLLDHGTKYPGMLELDTLKISSIICILIIHYAFIYFKLFNHVFENFYQYSVFINSLESHQELNPLAKIRV